MHLVISTHSPQYVFATNLWDGAWHLARRIVELDEEMRQVTDLSIYTKDRPMRMLGSSKYKKKQSVLEALDPTQAVRDHVITWLDDNTQVITVPEQIPVALKRRAKPKTVYDLSKAAREDPSVLSLRMLELFQEKVHASGYIWSAGDFDPLNPGVGVRLNFTDRTEKCYTGNVHSGNQNLRAWVEGEEILLKCWSDRCSSAPPYQLGPVAPIPTTYLEQAVHVNMKYLTRDKHVATAGTIDNLLQRREEDVFKLNQVIEDWRSGGFAALNIKAPMGSGKTTLLNTLIDEASPRTVLIMTYRQSLAQELGRKLIDLTVYLDVGSNDFPGLEDDKKYPKVIVQLDSLDRLSPTTIRRFDIVVVDEMVSVLRHISAKTLDQAMHIVGLMTHHLQKANKIITMDAFWNENCFQFLQRLQIPQKLVINDFRPPPRTYRWTKNEALFVQHIKEDLVAGKNVAVTSMATEFCQRLKRQLLDEGILTEGEIIMHTGMTDDKLRAKLNNVDALWLLMQDAGHHVIIDDTANVEAPSQDSSTKKQWLLHGRDISELEYATMHNNIVRRQASEEEKWLAFRYEYMEAWGIRMISEAFIDANGTQCGSLRLSRLRRLLQPAATRYCLAERELTPAQKQDIMRVGAVEEVINALGLKGPFDTAHTIEDLSSGEVRERVLNTECFKSWADMRRIFNTQASKTVWKTSSDVMGTIRVILDSIGLAVSAKRFREREAGTEVRPHSYKYWLSADAANNMQELLALKDGDIERAGKDISSADFSAIIARSCEASDEDKWLSYRFEYMRAWGLQAVDEDFVAQNGTQCGSEKVTRLMQVLDAAVDLPAPCSAARMYGAHLADSLRTEAVVEVIRALGFSGPFDLCHTIDNLSTGQVRERVLSTHCFQEWSDTRKLFSSRIKRKIDGWSAAEVREVVSIVLESIGLGLTTTKRTRQRNGGYSTTTKTTMQRNGRLKMTMKRARQVTATYQYMLKTDAVTKMKELLALQRKDIEGAGRWSHLL
eukprot:jgi/Astpho2/5840/Aster-02351